MLCIFLKKFLQPDHDLEPNATKISPLVPCATLHLSQKYIKFKEYIKIRS